MESILTSKRASPGSGVSDVASDSINDSSVYFVWSTTASFSDPVREIEDGRLSAERGGTSRSARMGFCSRAEDGGSLSER